ncbi:hypothetical protein F0562_007567 [Nyssa sinensis]|uniref:Bulb-type lectin domain-containing protein n=1 Tax=Nyssa sinensis TaxID=561372 RepID=A0A5J5A766_9ASTE|nr:hypothetical protein F0562_007567 [Nyssa sinensis]
MATKDGGSVNLISFLIFAFLCIWGLDCSLVPGGNTIGIGDELDSSTCLVSQDGRFTLGFFTLPYTNNSYFGIWYTYDEQANKVWIANPNTPILNNSGILLTIDDTGILKITSGGSITVNISDQVGTDNVTATLYDSGNFVLIDQTEGRILWESFDHPTNTLLPGMKLGQNLRTGQNWSLTSWMSTDDASSGAFTMSWERAQESGQLVIYRREEVYWKSGVLRNQRFEYLRVGNVYQYNLGYVSNNDEISFIIYGDGEIGNTPRWVLSPNGQILFADSTSSISSSDDFCYGYESNTGCATEWVVPECRDRNNKFKLSTPPFPGDLLPTIDDNESLILTDCMERCWKNCTCLGFASSDAVLQRGCVFGTRSTDFQINKTGYTDYKYVLVSQNSSKGIKRKIVVVAISPLVLLLGLFCYLRIRKLIIQGEEKERRKKYLRELTTLDNFNNENDVEIEEMQGHDMKIFSFASIVAATNNFSGENKLGQGGFGPVYKGRLSEGQEIAIKRLSKTSKQGLVEFYWILSYLKHRSFKLYILSYFFIN